MKKTNKFLDQELMNQRREEQKAIVRAKNEQLERIKNTPIENKRLKQAEYKRLKIEKKLEDPTVFINLNIPIRLLKLLDEQSGSRTAYIIKIIELFFKVK